MDLILDSSWQHELSDEFNKDYFLNLTDFVKNQRNEHEVFPPENQVFRTLQLTPFSQVKVVILGQDPYHDHGQAHGLAFSVKQNVKHPPSLRNIFKELNADLGLPIPTHGELTRWGEQGVLLLNTVLTVRAHEANSHRKKGWEKFTDAIIRKLGESAPHKVFLLWGKPAQSKAKLISEQLHTVLMSPHPSPLSANRGFFGSRPFSQTNLALKKNSQPEIDWQL